MENTLYTILTDADARNAEDVEHHLARDFSVGYFWFD